ncbi:endonuclease-reverse transcriptase [Plakobranchus ocellatus]|uniref:Endonuclease-reverse transcriptase n=1 Tax=Plakobranchus ocellatus TaxID=259542 RepID=A0AAV4BHV0_9GAST|nr:endonuclease-reverse transcriptase [Plakobranchus ocellatus]
MHFYQQRKISLKTRINVMRAYVWSILLYGCECWTLPKDTEQRPEAVVMWFIRRIIKVSWTKRKTNADIMDMAGYKKFLLNTIRERQIKIFGHIIRADELKNY